MAALNQMRHRKAYIKRYEPTQNVSLWLHRMNTERQIQGWSDSQAVAEASLSLGNVALTWFVMHCTQVTTWAEFESNMRARFGEDKQSIIARIKHRKQAENESVQLYADDMIMMFAQSELPHALWRDALLNNLKSGLKEDVMVTVPSTIEQVIANATFLEEKSVDVLPEKLKAWEQQQIASRQDPIKRLTRSMEKMSIAVANYWSRQEQHGAEPEASHYLSREEHRRYSVAPRWRPPRYGNRELHCTGADISSRHDENVFLHSAPSEVDLDYCGSTGCTPATPEALKYAQSLDRKAETLQAARLALAKCCTVVSGSDAVHTEARNITAARATEAMMKHNPCTISAKRGQAVQATGKALANCCAVVSGSDTVHTEASSGKAISNTSSVNKTAEQAMPEGLKSELYEKQASNGASRTSACDILQSIEASEAALDKTRETIGSSIKSTDELTALTSYVKKTKAYASPFSFSFSKPIAMPRIFFHFFSSFYNLQSGVWSQL